MRCAISRCDSEPSGRLVRCCERLLPRKNEFFALFSRHATLCVDGAGKLREMLDDLGQRRTVRGRHPRHRARGRRQSASRRWSCCTPRSSPRSIAATSTGSRVGSTTSSTTSRRPPRISGSTRCSDVAPRSARDGRRISSTRPSAMKATVDALAKRPELRARPRAVSRGEAGREAERSPAAARDRRASSSRSRIPKTLIKWKEIFENIEGAIDRCEDVANVIEGVALENA